MEESGRPVEPTRARRKRFLLGCLLLFIAIFISLVVIGSLIPPKPEEPEPTDQGPPEGAGPPPEEPIQEMPAPLLEVKKADWRWYREYDFVIAEGQVKNISNESLDGVEVVVMFEDKNGNYITSISTMIDYQPILPGQTSPWSAIGTWNPAMEGGKAWVEFKYIFGGTIETEYVE